MARGWESKSVEEQQIESTNSPTDSKESVSAEQRQRASAVKSLRLQRARVIAQLKDSQNPRFTELMQQELAYLEGELAKLDRSHE